MILAKIFTGAEWLAKKLRLFLPVFDHGDHEKYGMNVCNVYPGLLRKDPALFMTNFLFQRVLRVDSGFKYLKHYTSRVLRGENIELYGTDFTKPLKSFFASSGCYFQAANGIILGEGTFWSANVVIVSETYDYHDEYRTLNSLRPVVIGKHCWIGANVTILPEVQLGDYTVVGAGSVVTRSFPEGHVVIAGSPARKIKDIAPK